MGSNPQENVYLWDFYWQPLINCWWTQKDASVEQRKSSNSYQKGKYNRQSPQWLVMFWLFPPCPVVSPHLLRGQSASHSPFFSWTPDRQKSRREDSETEAREDTWQQRCEDYVSETLTTPDFCCRLPTKWLLQLDKQPTSGTCTRATVTSL